MLALNVLVEWFSLPLVEKSSLAGVDNELIKYPIDRVLWIGMTDVVLYEITNRKAFPRRELLSDIESAIVGGNARILEVDLFDYLLLPDSRVPAAHR
jgi:hypothetical protein